MTVSVPVPEVNEVSANANGGTEQQMRGLFSRVDPVLLSRFQIIPSRVRKLDESKIRILYCHDLAGDPEAERALANGNWSRFHRLVFVSNHQMQAFISRYSIPWERCVVMPNAIVPIPEHKKPEGPTRLIYTSTPQRGLDVLQAAFQRLAADDPEVELHVYSSFALYGWPETDAQFEPIFQKLRETERVTLFGTVPNDDIRTALQGAHVFAYPSTWEETSCICLIEAMSAGCVCVHPNFGALYETSARTTLMYQWREDKSAHAAVFHAVLQQAVEIARRHNESDDIRLKTQKRYADAFYNWESRAREWDAFLRSIAHLETKLNEKPAVPMFSYRVGG